MADDSLEYTREYLESIIQNYIDLLSPFYDKYKEREGYADLIAAYDDLLLCSKDMDKYTYEEIINLIEVYFGEAVEVGFFI